MNCLVLVRRGASVDARLRKMLPKESGKAKPLAWGPLDPVSHELYVCQFAELDLAVADALAGQTGALILLPDVVDNETVNKALAAQGLKPL